jgi:helix-turn-helix, Psq domain.
MPPIRSRNKQESVRQEGRILLAIQAIQNKSIASVAAAARVYDVPRSTLRDRVNGALSKPTTRANNHKLTQLDEDILTK